MGIGKSISFNFLMTKHLFKASPSYFWVNLLNTFLNAFSYIISTVFYKYIIDLIIYSENSLDNICVMFLLYYVISLANYCINFWVMNNYNEREKIKITLYYKRMIYHESVKKKIEKYNSDDYLNMLQNAVYCDGYYLYAFSQKLFLLIDAVIVFIFFFGIFLELHPIFIILAIVSAVKNIAFNSKNNKLNYCKYKINLSFERSNRYIHNLFYLKQYVKEFRLFSIPNYFIEKYKDLKQEWWNKSKSSVYKSVMIQTINEIVNLFIHMINIIILVYLLVHQLITVGEFSLILSNFLLIVENIQRVIMFIPTVFDDARYINDIFAVVNSEDHTFPKVNHTEDLEVVKFENVSFSYDGERTVLKNINIELPLNKKIAIVGENGSGKSTFIKLLLGLYSPTVGKIDYYYTNTDVHNSKQMFSALFQDYQIFPLTIAENLILKTNLNNQDKQIIENALRFGGIMEKIDDLPDGENTMLTGEFSEDGTYLSGGEQQKLAIARTYARENPILILDEPSSNLDPIAENKLIYKINQIANGKSVILISHNLLYTKNADMVIYFNNGRIQEYGTPHELMQSKGYYYKMMIEQLQMEGGKSGE